MAFSRHLRDGLNWKGDALVTSGAISAVRDGIKFGYVRIIKTFTLTQGDRLDTIAGAVYGDGRYWWVLAAGSNIGWGLQVPPGTVISVPDLKSVEALVG
jgi:nucleoid-associated protein YgaU